MWDLPPDPLLSSDSFIKTHSDTDTTGDQTLAIEKSDPTKTTVKLIDELPVNSVDLVKIPAKRGQIRKSDQMDLPNVSVPDWLPEGWYVEDRVRASGVTPRRVDKYYCDPLSGRKFRSSLEITRFQETGSKHKKKDTITSTDTPVKGSLSSSSQRKKKSVSKTIDPASNFDFSHVPDKIGWVLKDSSSWIPVVGNVMVDEVTKNVWADTFTSLATKKIN